MSIDLGLHTVNGKIAYHITDEVLVIGKVYDTKDIDRQIGEGSDKFYIEKVAEIYRISQRNIHNKDYPSRYSSLFVCDEEFVYYWYYYFFNRVGKTLRIYQVELEGELLGTYADYLKADMYWEPTAQFDLQEKEGVFEGEYKIVKQCDINEFQ